MAIVFGLAGAAVATEDIVSFLRPSSDRNFWWFTHMGGMVGSYIAAVSAFSVVNFSFLPTLVRWLWPTAVGVPLLLVWINSYRRRFSARRAAAEAEA